MAQMSQWSPVTPSFTGEMGSSKEPPPWYDQGLETIEWTSKPREVLAMVVDMFLILLTTQVEHLAVEVSENEGSFRENLYRSRWVTWMSAWSGQNMVKYLNQFENAPIPFFTGAYNRAWRVARVSMIMSRSSSGYTTAGHIFDMLFAMVENKDNRRDAMGMQMDLHNIYKLQWYLYTIPAEARAEEFPGSDHDHDNALIMHMVDRVAAYFREVQLACKNVTAITAFLGPSTRGHTACKKEVEICREFMDEWDQSDPETKNALYRAGTEGEVRSFKFFFNEGQTCLGLPLTFWGDANRV